MTSMDTPPATRMVSLSIEGPQANLTLTRPDKFNAMNVDMIQELILLLEWTAERSAGRRDALHDGNGQPYLRTLVLRGEGKHFCAGADINMMRDAGANTPEENRADSERLDRLFNGLWA
ncbi:MAG: enoyl-CoA hydratase/isomerase family protein, partial [Candidatus Thermoplasmatota archaeon]|nr:enoyl-CoA hydratase/isomerase family protein [Candidatus Thermoplasmatota archaeon]